MYCCCFYSFKKLGKHYASIDNTVRGGCETMDNTLQKQVGCFNHMVVALVADKLERRWLLEVYFDVED